MSNSAEIAMIAVRTNNADAIANASLMHETVNWLRDARLGKAPPLSIRRRRKFRIVDVFVNRAILITATHFLATEDQYVLI
jgi:hypothetical protein